MTERQATAGPARRPRVPGAGGAPRSPRGAARTAASSAGGPRSTSSSKRHGQASPSGSQSPETTVSPEGASSTELTVFGRRQVALPRGDDRVVSTGLADRLKERQQALRRLRLRRVVTVATVVLVAVLVTWALVFSPLLGLQTQRISVVGSDGSVSDKQVRDVLASYAGDSLLRLDTGRLSAQVSDKLVRVRQAQVTRAWPRGLRVQLTMRVPVATVQGPDGYQVLDNEAVVLDRVAEAPSGLVTIMPDSTDGASGSQTISAKQVAAVTQVVGSLTPQTLAQVTSGSATESGQVTLTLSNGASVVWGDTQDNALKARVLATLMTSSASVYDVSSPHRPTTRSADGATTASGTSPSAS
ncbi:FtsQ-type POTRA domain-containing protein [Actinomyces viscosus]|uniref:cell division protein FtsQ/DivIB n=1 Tax=Actinomyces viscosus TaxID=1656 RepID=UPI0028E35B9F|nr:FtsQ-type POTRA domain-containing protein [Actinomyces viscosus]